MQCLNSIDLLDTFNSVTLSSSSLILLILGVTATSAWAQVSGSTRNPADLPNTIDQIDEERDPIKPFPGMDAFFQPWYDFKDRSAEKGIRFGIAGTSLYQYSSNSLTGRKDAAGSILEAVGTWTLLGRGTDHPGMLGFKIEGRYAHTSVPPQNLFTQLGGGWPTALAFSEFDLSLAEFWWEQHFIKDRLSVRIGKVLPFGSYDYFRFKNPKTGFTNASFTLNPSIAWASFGLGAVVDIRPHDDYYLTFGVHDANGTPEGGFDSFFDEGELFVVAEMGWDPGFLSSGGKNLNAPDLHATFWHSDARKKAGRPDGWGFTLSGEQTFCEKYVGFIRYGYSDGGAAMLEHMVSGGLVLTNAFNYEQDSIGVGFGWGRPSAAKTRDQWNTEIFYKMQLTRRLAITPNVQFIRNPARNPQHDFLALAGLRARLDF